MYRITLGNDYVRSRPLTAEELDATLTTLRDVFADGLYVMSIEAEEPTEKESS